jgi:hypothetical protein
LRGACPRRGAAAGGDRVRVFDEQVGGGHGSGDCIGFPDERLSL